MTRVQRGSCFSNSCGFAQLSKHAPIHRQFTIASFPSSNGPQKLLSISPKLARLVRMLSQNDVETMLLPREKIFLAIAGPRAQGRRKASPGLKIFRTNERHISARQIREMAAQPLTST